MWFFWWRIDSPPEVFLHALKILWKTFRSDVPLWAATGIFSKVSRVLQFWFSFLYTWSRSQKRWCRRYGGVCTEKLPGPCPQRCKPWRIEWKASWMLLSVRITYHCRQRTECRCSFWTRERQTPQPSYSGTGKSHLANAIGILVNELIEAREERDLQRLLAWYCHYELLILDDLGYKYYFVRPTMQLSNVKPLTQYGGSIGVQLALVRWWILINN